MILCSWANRCSRTHINLQALLFIPLHVQALHLYQDTKQTNMSTPPSKQVPAASAAQRPADIKTKRRLHQLNASIDKQNNKIQDLEQSVVERLESCKGEQEVLGLMEMEKSELEAAILSFSESQDASDSLSLNDTAGTSSPSKSLDTAQMDNMIADQKVKITKSAELVASIAEQNGRFYDEEFMSKATAALRDSEHKLHSLEKTRRRVVRLEDMIAQWEEIVRITQLDMNSTRREDPVPWDEEYSWKDALARNEGMLELARERLVMLQAEKQKILAAKDSDG